MLFVFGLILFAVGFALASMFTVLANVRIKSEKFQFVERTKVDFLKFFLAGMISFAGLICISFAGVGVILFLAKHLLEVAGVVLTGIFSLSLIALFVFLTDKLIGDFENILINVISKNVKFSP